MSEPKNTIRPTSAFLFAAVPAALALGAATSDNPNGAMLGISALWAGLRLRLIYDKKIEAKAFFLVLAIFLVAFIPVLYVFNLIGKLLEDGLTVAFASSLFYFFLVVYGLAVTCYLLLNKLMHELPDASQSALILFEEVVLYSMAILAVWGVVNPEASLADPTPLAVLLSGVLSVLAWEKWRAPMLAHLMVIGLFLLANWLHVVDLLFHAVDYSISLMAVFPFDLFWFIVMLGSCFALLALAYFFSTSLSWKASWVNTFAVCNISLYLRLDPSGKGYAQYRHFLHKITAERSLSGLLIAFLQKTPGALLGRSPSWFSYTFDPKDKTRYEQYLQFQLEEIRLEKVRLFKKIQIARLTGDGAQLETRNEELRLLLLEKITVIEAYLNYSICPAKNCPHASFSDGIWPLVFQVDRALSQFQAVSASSSGPPKPVPDAVGSLQEKVADYYMDFPEEESDPAFVSLLQWRLQALTMERSRYFNRIELKEKVIWWVRSWAEKKPEWSRFAVCHLLSEYWQSGLWREIIDVCQLLRKHQYCFQPEDLLIQGEAYLQYATQLNPALPLTAWVHDQAIKCFYQAKAPEVLHSFPQILKAKAHETVNA
ncbi:MAG: hypothetical protein H6557_01605 [Lewinellaceae bacterium]|nr:hypothetical protein [Phaeodactylibacter sp.]MCB9035293.1 hypothetical protein [Lewinellaceae bacterium]